MSLHLLITLRKRRGSFISNFIYQIIRLGQSCMGIVNNRSVTVQVKSNSRCSLNLDRKVEQIWI
jgi:hypothetical protein